MQVLAHRGMWRTPAERNSHIAFERAISNGFGIETDVRDQGGRLVVSHDLPTGPCLDWHDFLRLFPTDSRAPLAVNIKADGLQALFAESLSIRPGLEAFAFDMSVPDALGYARARLPFFTRQSEYEPAPSLFDQAAGVWADQFEGDWVSKASLSSWARDQKRVCIVSPELHRRPHLEFWARLRAALIEIASTDAQVSLCTDFPMQAREFFQLPPGGP